MEQRRVSLEGLALLESKSLSRLCMPTIRQVAGGLIASDARRLSRSCGPGLGVLHAFSWYLCFATICRGALPSSLAC